MWQLIHHGKNGETVVATFTSEREAISVRNGYLACGTEVFLRKIS